MLALNLNADVDPIFITVVGLSLATVIAIVVRWALKTANTLIKGQAVIHEQVLGREETKQQPAIPSLKEHFDTIDLKFAAVDQRFDSQDATLVNLEHEVQTNDGSSLKDDVKALRASVATKDDIKRVETKLDTHMTDTAKEVAAATKATPKPRKAAKRAARS